MSVDLDALLKLLQHGNQLKRTPRTGWVMRGVPNPENVAAHTYGVAYTALILAPHLDVELNMAKLFSLILLHDLAEGLTTDIPKPAWKYLPQGIKSGVERKAMEEIVGEGAQGEQLMALWEEMDQNETAEAKFVHDVDKIDMYLQVLAYERHGTQALREFWDKKRTFHYSVVQKIYERLRYEAGV